MKTSLINFIFQNILYSNMSPDILSVFSKFWDKKGVTFLHDSYRCSHCLNSGVNIVRFKPSPEKSKDELFEDVPQTFYKKADIKVYKSDLPQDSFCQMGIILTDKTVEKLKENNPGFHSEKSTRGKNRLMKRNTKDCLKTIENKIKLKKELNATKTKRMTKTELTTSKTKAQKCKQKSPNTLKRNNKKISKTHFVSNTKNRSRNFKISTKDIIQKAIFKKILSNSKISPKSKGYKKLPEANSSLGLKTFKEPAVGTLKRKRWQMKNLKLSHESHEDDLFEEEKFDKFKPMTEDDSDSEKYEKIITPSVSLSPAKETSKSPNYDDCYSPNELFINRKEAEEYLYRREKRRKRKLHDEKSSNEESPEKFKNSAEYTEQTLAETCKILEKVAMCKPEEESDSGEEKDDYFSEECD